MGKVMVTTVPGTENGQQRTVAYVHVRDDGKRICGTVTVTGNRARVRANLAALTQENNVIFEANYEK